MIDTERRPVEVAAQATGAREARIRSLLGEVDRRKAARAALLEDRELAEMMHAKTGLNGQSAGELDDPEVMMTNIERWLEEIVRGLERENERLAHLWDEIVRVGLTADADLMEG